MTTDQPVISLRPGGGGGGIGLRAPRLFPTAFAAAATGAGDFLRPHGGSSTGFAAKVTAVPHDLELGAGRGGGGARWGRAVF